MIFQTKLKFYLKLYQEQVFNLLVVVAKIRYFTSVVVREGNWSKKDFNTLIEGLQSE